VDHPVDDLVDRPVESGLLRADPIRELLVRGPNWLGDLIMSTPALRALREGLPEARITLLVKPGLETLLEGSPRVDRVIPLRSHHAGLGATWREARALARESQWDTGLCIPESISSALFMRLAGVRRVVGYGRAGRGVLLQPCVRAPREWGPRRTVPRERFALGLVEALGLPTRGTQLELHTTPEGERAALGLLASHDLDPSAAPLVAIAPGASFGPSKHWPASYFAEVGDRLSRAGARVVLIGSAGEASLCHAVAAQMKGAPTVLAGDLDLGGLKSLIRRMSLLLCNDAGARHLAAAFEVPSIAFFGPTSLAKTNLNLEHVHVMQNDADCRPCYRRRCPIDHRCLRDIRPETVTPIAIDLLAKGHGQQISAEGG
jgi:heptosyltransferase-2